MDKAKKLFEECEKLSPMVAIKSDVIFEKIQKDCKNCLEEKLKDSFYSSDKEFDLSAFYSQLENVMHTFRAKNLALLKEKQEVEKNEIFSAKANSFDLDSLSQGFDKCQNVDSPTVQKSYQLLEKNYIKQWKEMCNPWKYAMVDPNDFIATIVAQMVQFTKSELFEINERVKNQTLQEEFKQLEIKQQQETERMETCIQQQKERLRNLDYIFLSLKLIIFVILILSSVSASE
eukprot:Awhi_evm2s10461